MNRQEKLQDALEWVETLQENYGGQEETQDLAEALGVAAEAIKALEQARWIPVSERLPKPDEFVLVTYKRWGHGDNDLFKDLPEYVYSTYFAYYDIHRGFGNENENVIAWMPLPEPYKEDKA